MDLASLYSSFSNDKRLKIVKTVVPFNKEFTLIDVSIRNRNSEEGIFKSDLMLAEKLHRGTTFVMNNGEISWGRRGQKKFFEAKSDDLPFQIGTGVTIWKSLKVNGENAQISYLPALDSWILGSKNVSLAARNETDLELYDGLRFNFAKMIALVWFSNILQFTESELRELKSDLTDYTMIGEYIGNPDCQHIIKYDKISIEFFSLVQNHSLSFCCSSEISEQFFEKFRLNHIKCEKIEICENTKKLSEILTEIKNLPIETGQEGSVLYFCSLKETIWMSKVKTLEYKAMRKLREIIKRVGSERALEEFKPFIKEQELKTGRSLEDLLKKAEKVIKDVWNSKLTIQNNFADVLSNTQSNKVFISIGIPGIGKSYLITKLMSIFPTLSVVSSDEIRFQQMEELKAKNSNLSFNDLFSRAGKSSQNIFNANIQKSKFPLYIDKNFPPRGFSSLTSVLNNSSIIGFYQKSKGLKINQKFWPFSIEVLYTCIKRIINRDNHPLIGLQNTVKACQIIILIYNLYQGFKISWYLDNGVQRIVPVNFVDEDKVRVPDEFREKIEKILSILKIGKEPDAQSVENVLLTVDQDKLVFEDIKIGEAVPLYIGIEIDIPGISFIIKALSELKQNFPENIMIQEDFNDISTMSSNMKPLKSSKLGWSIPSTLHITLLYIGQNSKVLHSQHYKNFQSGIEFKFTFTHFVYVPQKLFIGVVKFIDKEPLVSNKFPHVTILSRKVANKLSNDVLESADLTETISVQNSLLGEYFSIPVNLGQFIGVSKEFY